MCINNIKVTILTVFARRFWGFIACAIGQTAVYASLAEMASISPTAGGQYHWASDLPLTYSHKLLEVSNVLGYRPAGIRILASQIPKASLLHLRVAHSHRLAGQCTGISPTQRSVAEEGVDVSSLCVLPCRYVSFHALQRASPLLANDASR